MDRVLFIVIILIIYVLYALFKHKEIWKKLSLGQNLGVAITFFSVIGVGGMILFYSAKYIEAITSSEVVRVIFQFLCAIIIVIFFTVLFNKVVTKITNGVLPLKRKQ